MSKRFPYDQAIADEICDRLIDGESLRAICRDEHMPSAGLVCRWAIENERFREQYAHARDAQADTLADEILEIADDARNDWMERHGKDDPGWSLNGEHVQRSKVRIDARRWYAGKLKPKKYGDNSKLDVTSNGETIGATRESLIEQATRLGINPAALGFDGSAQEGNDA